MQQNQIILGNNLDVVSQLPSESISLIYIDPPFNTGRIQKLGDNQYEDKFDDFIGFLEPRVKEAHRLLKENGAFFLHLDYREVHYAKVMVDGIFGRVNFLNEIIWAYDYGGRSKTRWSCKHDNILWYVKDNKNYTFNFDQMERIPYMAPGLVGPEKAARGKTLTDTWWSTIVPTNGKERLGYPTQKPLTILKRIIVVHSNEGDLVLDMFAGSGTTGEAAAMYNRKFMLIDNNPEAVEVMKKRLAKYLTPE